MVITVSRPAIRDRSNDRTAVWLGNAQPALTSATVDAATAWCRPRISGNVIPLWAVAHAFRPVLPAKWLGTLATTSQTRQRTRRRSSRQGASARRPSAHATPRYRPPDAGTTSAAVVPRGPTGQPRGKGLPGPSPLRVAHATKEGSLSGVQARAPTGGLTVDSRRTSGVPTLGRGVLGGRVFILA